MRNSSYHKTIVYVHHSIMIFFTEKHTQTILVLTFLTVIRPIPKEKSIQKHLKIYITTFKSHRSPTQHIRNFQIACISPNETLIRRAQKAMIRRAFDFLSRGHDNLHKILLAGMNQLCFCKLIRRHFNIMLFCYVNDGNKTLSRMNQSIMRQTAQSPCIVCNDTTGYKLMHAFNLDVIHRVLGRYTLYRVHPRFRVQTECFWKFHTREPSQPYILIIPQTQKIRQ